MSLTEATPPVYPPGYLEEYNGKPLFAVSVAFIVLEIFFVVLRFWARKIGNVRWGADDIFIILGLMCSVGVCVCSLVNLAGGAIGYHEAEVLRVNPTGLIGTALMTFCITMLYIPAVLFPKLAILSIYLHVFTDSIYRKICWFLAGLLIANCVASAVTGFLICTPLNYFWDRRIPGGHCLNITAYLRWIGVNNIVTDVAMLLLPLPIIRKLQISRNLKIGLTFTFATGSIGLITAIVRFVGFFTSDITIDGTYSGTALGILTTAESGTYLIAACLPTYRPLAVIIWKTASPYLSKGSTGSKGSKGFMGSKSRTFHQIGKTQPSHDAGDTDVIIEIPLEGRKKFGFEQVSDENPRVGGGFYREGYESAIVVEDKRGIVIRREYEVV